MTNVYANCTFNLSADASEDGYCGLFRERALEYPSPFLITRDSDESHYLCYVDTSWDDVDKAPLGRRAWVVQERFLAPRVIHFGEHQVHFECLQRAVGEFYPDTFQGDGSFYTFKRLPGSFDHTSPTHKASQADLYQRWDQLVFQYSMCTLTYPSDMPFAIEGLARILGNLLGLWPNDYLHGLWRGDLAHELMWSVVDGQWRCEDYQRTPDVNAPSWSWLAIHEGTCSSLTEGKYTNLLDVTDLDETQPHLTSLKVRGQLCEATLKTCGQPSYKDEDIKHLEQRHRDFVMTVGQAQFKDVESCFLYWDEATLDIYEDLQSRPLYLLLGRKYGETQEDMDSADKMSSLALHGLDQECPPRFDHQYNPSRYDCLILSPTERNTSFRRVGYVELGGPGHRRRWGDEERTSWFEHERPVLDQQFRSDDVPSHYYEEVDDDHNYTFWLV